MFEKICFCLSTQSTSQSELTFSFEVLGFQLFSIQFGDIVRAYILQWKINKKCILHKMVCIHIRAIDFLWKVFILTKRWSCLNQDDRIMMKLQWDCWTGNSKLKFFNYCIISLHYCCPNIMTYINLSPRLGKIIPCKLNNLRILTINLDFQFTQTLKLIGKSDLCNASKLKYQLNCQK